MKYVIFKFELIILFLLCSNSNLFAQNWNTENSTWYYGAFVYPNVTYVTIKLTGDTIINNQLCQKVEGECSCAYFASKYMYEDSNRVYRYDENLEEFHLLYDFNLNAGESWELYIDDSNGPFEIYVDSVKHIELNGDSLKVQFISFDDIYIDMGDSIIEGFGSSRCMFPKVSICDYGYGPLRCFENIELGIEYNFTNGMACDTMYSLVNLDEKLVDEKIKIYPNPITNTLRISSNENGKRNYIVELYSVIGEKINEFKYYNIEIAEIDMSNLQSGIFIVCVINEDGKFVKKIIKD